MSIIDLSLDNNNTTHNALWTWNALLRRFCEKDLKSKKKIQFARCANAFDLDALWVIPLMARTFLPKIPFFLCLRQRTF